MQLTPRYGVDPVISLDGSPADIAGPAIRQRHRLAVALASFSDEQWAHPSRCDGWSSRDVIVHLDSTNSFWAFSIAAGLRGEPTQFLATFDPVVAPAQLVAGNAVSTSEVLDRFVVSTEQLTGLLASLDDDDWSVLAEAPPGHVSISAVTHHALWDSWVHERDILLPLGIAPVEAADEVEACLRYGAALGPAFAINRGNSDTGTLTLAVTDPDVAVVVEIGDHDVTVRSGTATADLCLAGNAVDLLEAFSIRKPFDQPIPAASAWMLRGLAETFDVDDA